MKKRRTGALVLLWMLCLGLTIGAAQLMAAEINGTVMDSSGNPITGEQNFNIFARMEDYSTAGHGYVNSANGTYTITDLEAGTYFLEAYGITLSYMGGYWTADGSVTENFDEATPVTVTADQVVTRDFFLEQGGSISGEIRDSNGDPITGEGFSIYVYSGDICNYDYDQVGNGYSSTGSYEITGLPAGNHYIEVSGYNSSYIDGYWTSTGPTADRCAAEAVTVTAGQTTTGTNFTLDLGGAISGVVQDSNGNPITGESFSIYVYSGDLCNYSSDQVGSGYSDSTTGSYEVSGLPAGNHYIEVWGYNSSYIDGYWTSTEPTTDRCAAETVTVTAGQTTTDKDFTLALGGTISGVVKDSSGNPVTGGGIFIQLYGVDVCGWNSYIGSTWVDDSNGSYKTDALRAGNYYLQAYNSDSQFIGGWWVDGGVVDSRLDAEPVPVNSGQDTGDTDFILELGGSISGVLRDSSGNLITNNIGVNVYSGDPCGSYLNVGYGYPDSNGTYKVGGLPAGSYHIRTNRYSGSPYINGWWATSGSSNSCNVAQPVTVNVGQTTSGKDFSLNTGGSVSGEIRDSSGNSISDSSTYVYVYSGDPCSSYEWINTGYSYDGSYEVTGLPTGSYHLRAYNYDMYVGGWWAASGNSNNCENAGTVSIIAGQATTEKHFSLIEGATISGVIRDPQGNAITCENIYVEAYNEIPCSSPIPLYTTYIDEYSGAYETSVLPAGEYYLQAYVAYSTQYSSGWWAESGSSNTCDAATLIPVSAGEELVDYDFWLINADDLDGDGIPNSVEDQSSCLSSTDADSDDDGIPDGDEDVNANGLKDQSETHPCEVDSDGDGVQDGTEIGLTTSDISSDTDTGVFQPDLDPSTTTDPLNSDSDGDGLTDGEEDLNTNGRVDSGESNPGKKEVKLLPAINALLLESDS